MFRFKIDEVGEYSTNFKKMDQNKKATVIFFLSSGESAIAWNITSPSTTSGLNFWLWRQSTGPSRSWAASTLTSTKSGGDPTTSTSPYNCLTPNKPESALTSKSPRASTSKSITSKHPSSPITEKTMENSIHSGSNPSYPYLHPD